MSLTKNKKRDENLNLKVMLVVLLVVILMLSIANVYVFSINNQPTKIPLVNNNTNTANKDSNDTVNDDIQKTPTEQSKSVMEKDFSSLTKEDAIEAAMEMAEDENRSFLPNGIILEPYTGLFYSYDDVSQIKEIAMLNFFPISRVLDNAPTREIIIETTNEHYSIVTARSNKEEDVIRYRKGVMFNKKYYDYNDDDKTGTGIVASSKFNDTSSEFVNIALPIVAYLEQPISESSYNNVYNYILEEQPDKYIITFNKIGLGVNQKKLDEMLRNDSDNFNLGNPIFSTLSINLYSYGYELDKQTGRLSYLDLENDGLLESYDLSDKDIKRIKSKMGQ